MESRNRRGGAGLGHRSRDGEGGGENNGQTNMQTALHLQLPSSRPGTLDRHPLSLALTYPHRKRVNRIET
jgi:hypothetical protein